MFFTGSGVVLLRGELELLLYIFHHHTLHTLVPCLVLSQPVLTLPRPLVYGAVFPHGLSGLIVFLLISVYLLTSRYAIKCHSRFFLPFPPSPR